MLEKVLHRDLPEGYCRSPAIGLAELKDVLNQCIQAQLAILDQTMDSQSYDGLAHAGLPEERSGQNGRITWLGVSITLGIDKPASADER
jgi:hypothetical protein